MDVLSWNEISKSVFHAGVLGFDAVSHLMIPLFPAVRISLFFPEYLFAVASSFGDAADVDEGAGVALLHIALVFLRVESLVAASVINGDGDVFKEWDEPGGFMAVAMDSPCIKNEAVTGINDDDGFKVVSFLESPSNAFDIREACGRLHHAGAIDDSTRSGFHDLCEFYE